MIRRLVVARFPNLCLLSALLAVLLPFLQPAIQLLMYRVRPLKRYLQGQLQLFCIVAQLESKRENLQ